MVAGDDADANGAGDGGAEDGDAEDGDAEDGATAIVGMSTGDGNDDADAATTGTDAASRDVHRATPNAPTTRTTTTTETTATRPAPDRRLRGSSAITFAAAFAGAVTPGSGSAAELRGDDAANADGDDPSRIARRTATTSATDA